MLLFPNYLEQMFINENLEAEFYCNENLFLRLDSISKSYYYIIIIINM